MFSNPPSAAAANPVKSDIFEMYSQGMMLTSLRTASGKCSGPIRSLYSLLDNAGNQTREPTQAEVERNFSQFAECIGRALQDDSSSSESSCSSAKRAMTAACGKDLEVMTKDMERELQSQTNPKHAEEYLIKQFNTLPHRGSSSATRCEQSMGEFFKCLTPEEDPRGQEDFEKLLAIQMFMVQSQQQMAGGRPY